MKIMTATEASEFCKTNKVDEKYWSCGYTLEVTLELDYGIKLNNDNAWKELEDLLYYNA